jgi:hypothetical protein
MKCKNTYTGNNEGLVLFDGIMHAEYWCSWSCLFKQIETGNETPKEIWGRVSDWMEMEMHREPEFWFKTDNENEGVGTVCGSNI